MVQTLIFMIPFMLVCGWAFWGMFAASWRADESSPNPGGLTDYWILKATLLVMVALLLLQALTIIARSILVLRGREEFALKSGMH